jgi:gamma-glutamyltranspeptidase/glutathione hydrolase
VIDAEGNGVTIIQSVYAELGSGVVGVESGVLLNNRLIGFFLDPERANALAPGRRTMHTLHNFMALDARGLRWVGGSPGGDNQPQVNLQVLARLLDFGEAPSAAIGAPRWSLARHQTPGARRRAGPCLGNRAGGRGRRPRRARRFGLRRPGEAQVARGQ